MSHFCPFLLRTYLYAYGLTSMLAFPAQARQYGKIWWRDTLLQQQDVALLRCRSV